jgi:hypothetical protein
MRKNRFPGLKVAAACWRPLLVAALTAALSACGGGGGSSSSSNAPALGQALGPPTAGATLANSTTEASEGSKAMVAGADAMVTQYGAMTGFAALLGAPVGMQASPAEASAHVLSAPTPAAAGTATPLAAQAVTCGDFVDMPCTGGVTMDTSIAVDATAIVAGDYADIRFTKVSGRLQGRSTVLDGHLRIDFLTAVSANSTQLTSLSVLLTMDAFNGSVNGNAFGPITQVARLDIDSNGAGTLTAAGATFAGMSGVTVTSSGNYAVASGRVRIAYWGNAGQYVDLNLTNWRVAGGRPQVGSTASVAAAVGSATLRVTASSQTTVVYAVSLTAGGSTLTYVVTATYPTGGGAPTYSTVRG